MSERIRNAILLATPDHLKTEIQKYLRETPFQEMNFAYSRENDCAGIMMGDEEGGMIYLLYINSYENQTDNDEAMLSIFLHELVHFQLWKNRAQNWHMHEENFMKINSIIQMKYGVTWAVNHNYDQQNCHIKQTVMQTSWNAYNKLKSNSDFDVATEAERVARIRNEQILSDRILVVSIFSLIFGGFAVYKFVDFPAISHGTTVLLSGSALLFYLWWMLVRNPD